MCLERRMALEMISNKIELIHYREMFLHYKYLTELNNKRMEGRNVAVELN